MAETTEIQPIDSRIVCINHPHLRQMWLLGSLTKTLGCFYNPHQPQVIWTQCRIPVPTPRMVRVKGHASHPLPSMDTNEITTSVQMGTYLVFYMPWEAWASWSSCHLIIYGVESILKGQKNPSKFNIQLVTEAEDNSLPKRPDISTAHCSLTKDKTCNSSHQNTEEDCNANNNMKNARNGTEPLSSYIYPLKSYINTTLDFEVLEEITTLAEEEDNVPSDEDTDDASDDIHKVVRRRLVANINEMMTEWEKHNSDSNLLTLLLRPAQHLQAWQFTSSWISISKDASDTESESPKSKTKRKILTRTKPISPASTATLKKIPKNKDHTVRNELNGDTA